MFVKQIFKVFNSIGIAFGSLIAFSSYNKFRGPVLRDTLIVTMVDAVISLMCGCAVFAVLGNLAHEQGKQVDQVVADGPGLVIPDLRMSKADMVLAGILPIDNLTDFGPSVELLVSKVNN